MLKSPCTESIQIGGNQPTRMVSHPYCGPERPPEPEIDEDSVLGPIDTDRSRMSQRAYFPEPLTNTDARKIGLTAKQCLYHWTSITHSKEYCSETVEHITIMLKRRDMSSGPLYWEVHVDNKDLTSEAWDSEKK